MTVINNNLPAPRRRILPRLGAVILIGFGSLLVIGSFITTGDPESDSANGPLGVFGGLMIAAGGLLIVRANRREREEREQYDQRQVLTVASRYGGRATIAQVAMETTLSPERAEETLSRLCRQNIAQPDLLDDGTVVYVFGMLTEQRA